MTTTTTQVRKMTPKIVFGKWPDSQILFYVFKRGLQTGNWRFLSLWLRCHLSLLPILRMKKNQVFEQRKCFGKTQFDDDLYNAHVGSKIGLKQWHIGFKPNGINGLK